MLEEVSVNPELILTDLFSQDADDENFFYQININGKYILDYFEDCLKTAKVFQNVKLVFNGYDLYIYVSSLKYQKYPCSSSKDLIMKINMSNKTFRLIERDKNKYLNILKKNTNLK